MTLVTTPGTGPSEEQIREYQTEFAKGPFSALPPENLPVRAALLSRAQPVDPLERLSEFQERYPEGFLAMRVVGAHPTESKGIPNPYDPAAAREDFSNMGVHMLHAAQIVEPLSLTLAKFGVITQDEALLVIKMTAAHDLNKPAEVCRRNAALNGKFNGDPYSDAAYQAQRDVLAAQGVASDLIDYIVVSGADTGHGSFKNFVRVDESGSPRVLVTERWVQALVHLADDMAYSTKPQAKAALGDQPINAVTTSLDRMILATFNVSHSKLGYAWMWTEGLGATTEGKVVDIKDVSSPPNGIRALGNYAWFQPKISDAICAEFKRIVAPDDERPANVFVRDFVQRWHSGGRLE